jgi:hypothetical protein
MLCTPKLLPRKSSSESMPLRTMSSRGMRLFPAAKQVSLKPLTDAFTALLGAAHTSGTPPEARVDIMIGPLRVCRALGSTPYFLKRPFSIPTHIGAMVSL